VARSQKRSGRSGRRSTPKDWVYQQQAYGVDTIFLGPGSVNAIALPLTVSQNARRHITSGSISTEPNWASQFVVQSGAAMPEGSKQRVFAVDGWVAIVPQDLAAGTAFTFGMRLLHQDQYPVDGEMITDAGYSMFEDTTPNVIAQYANAGFLREWWRHEVFSTAIAGLVNKASFNMRVQWRSRRGLTLGNDRALYLYMESHPGSRELTIWTRMRCLMGADAST